MTTSTDQAIHTSYMHRILIDIADDELLSQTLAFKGGTCAVMLGYLDRFSVDLDFDCFEEKKINLVKKQMLGVFDNHGLELKKKFDEVIMYELGYPNPKGKRSTLKVSVNTIPSPKNQVEIQHLPAINRYMNCQTIETMFANKLIAVEGRFIKWGSVAARDLYDIHHFFINGYRYSAEVVEDRSGKLMKEYLNWMIEFIPKHFNQQTIDEGLNHLLSYEIFRSLRKVLIPETISFLRDEMKKSL